MSATLDDKSANRSVAQLRRANPVSAFFARRVVRRLIGCLSLGFMLALMVGGVLATPVSRCAAPLYI